MLLGLGLLAARLMRRAPGATRHQLWTTAFAAVLLMPLLAATLPSVPVPVPARWASTPAAAPRTAGPQAAPAVQSHDLRPGLAIATAAGPEAAARRARSDRAIDRAQIDLRRALTATLLASESAGARGDVGLVPLARARRPARAETSAIRPGAGGDPRVASRTAGRRAPHQPRRRDAGGGIFKHIIFAVGGGAGASAATSFSPEIAHPRDVRCGIWSPGWRWRATGSIHCPIAARQAAIARERACDRRSFGLGTLPRPARSSSCRIDAVLRRRAPHAHRRAFPTGESRHGHLTDASSRQPAAVQSRGGGLIAPAIAVLEPVALVSAPVATPSCRAGGVADPPPRRRGAGAVRSGVVAGAGPRLRPGTGRRTGRTRLACSWGCLAPVVQWQHLDDRQRRRRRLREQITRGSERVIRKPSAATVCLVAEAVGGQFSDPPSRWIGRARRVVLETRHGGATERLEIADRGGLQQVKWEVGGRERAMDAAAGQWRERLLAVLDTTWELATLRGQASSLRGEISSIYGQRSSLNGEISSLRGHVSSLRGEISSVRGQESSLHGEISSIRGHLSSLRGSISSERGTISSLTSGGYRSDDSAAIRDAIARHDKEIARIEQEIRAYDADAKVTVVVKEIAALQTERKVAAIETEIKNFDLDGKVAAIEKQIAALDVAGKTAAIGKQIDGLDSDRRVRQLEERRDEELKRLTAAIAAIR